MKIEMKTGSGQQFNTYNIRAAKVLEQDGPVEAYQTVSYTYKPPTYDVNSAEVSWVDVVRSLREFESLH